MNFTSKRRTFYEFTIKPIIYGSPCIVTPTKYVVRDEGKSNLGVFHYLKMGILFVDTAIKLKSEKKRKDKKELE